MTLLFIRNALLVLSLSVPLSGCRDDSNESNEELALSSAAFDKAKNIVKEASRFLPDPKNWSDGCFARALFLSAELVRGGVAPYQVAVAPCDDSQTLNKIGAAWHVAAAVQTRPRSNPKDPGGLMIFDPAFGTVPLDYTAWRDRLGLSEKRSGGNDRRYNSMMFPGSDYFIGLTEFDRRRGIRNIHLLGESIVSQKCDVRLKVYSSDISLTPEFVDFKINALEDACRTLVDIYDTKVLGLGGWNENQKRLAARFNQTARKLKEKDLIFRWESGKFCCQRHLKNSGWPRPTVSQIDFPSEEAELCFSK
jgi:hypothetical protein